VRGGKKAWTTPWPLARPAAGYSGGNPAIGEMAKKRTGRALSGEVKSGRGKPPSTPSPARDRGRKEQKMENETKVHNQQAGGEGRRLPVKDSHCSIALQGAFPNLPRSCREGPRRRRAEGEKELTSAQGGRQIPI